MVRRRSKARRDISKPDFYNAIARPDEGLPRRPAPLVSRPILLDVADHRTFTPDPVRNAVSSRRWRHRLVLSPAKPVKRATTPRVGRSLFFNQRPVLTFQAPKSVVVCVRRAIRKEVIHAHGHAGGKVRRPHRNEFSDISCRRK